MEKISKVKKFFAKLIDYSAFLGAVILLFDPTSKALLTWILLVTLAWMPLNVLLLKCFKTTLGLRIMGIQTETRLSLSTLVRRAFLFPKELVPCKKKWLPRILSALVFGSILFYSVPEIDTYNLTHAYHGKANKKLNWKKYAHPNGLCNAEFPKKPSARTTSLKVPDKEVKQVDLQESYYTDRGGKVEYTLSAIEIPAELLSWGYKLVLKGALKIVENNTPGSKVLSKKQMPFNNKPSLHYYLDEKESERMGRLILIENVIYKLEVRYPKEMKDELQQESFKFIDSFS